MKAVSVAEMRKLESRAIAAGISGFTLMERAGTGAAGLIEAEFHRRQARRVAVVTGRGNNAGDGFVAAAALKVPTVIFAAAPVEALRGDAAAHAARLPAAIPVCGGAPDFQPGDLIVDALLGTGFAGGVREPLAGFMAAVNASGCPVISLDLPSGLDGDSGAAGEIAVRAELTITFGLPKAGLFRGRGPELAGPVRVVPIGIPSGLEAGTAAEFEVFTAADGRAMLPRPAFDAHKNTRGRLLVLAGSAAYSGAAALTTRAAFAGGAGMVHLAAPALPFAALPAALIVHRIAGNAAGEFDFAAWRELTPLLSKIDAVAAGPGWGGGTDLSEVVAALLATGLPLALDADALNAVARRPELWRGRAGVAITPHVGEAARLFAAFGETFPADRAEAARKLAARLGAVVVLKGPQSVVAAPDGRFSFNTSGTAALAAAGSGDVLTGLLGALLAERRDAFDAARLAVLLHGLSGESVPRRGLLADELPERIRTALAEVAPVC